MVASNRQRRGYKGESGTGVYAFGDKGQIVKPHYTGNVNRRRRRCDVRQVHQSVGQLVGWLVVVRKGVMNEYGLAASMYDESATPHRD